MDVVRPIRLTGLLFIKPLIVSLPLSLITLLFTPPAHADSILSALVSSYPDHLSSYDNNTIIWHNGKRMPVSDGGPDKSFEQRLARPGIKDQFALAYPVGTDFKIPARNEDPGRFRN